MLRCTRICDKHVPVPRDWNGVVAQLVERLVRNEKVAGSSPVGSTIPNQALTAVSSPSSARRSNLRSNLSRFRRVSTNLFRFVRTGGYYCVQKVDGKAVWRSLDTTDREEAKSRMVRMLADPAPRKPGPAAVSTGGTLDGLLAAYEANLSGKALKTRQTRLSILGQFRRSWPHAISSPVPTITAGQLHAWLASQRSRMKAATFNEYIRFLRQTFELAVALGWLKESPASGIKLVKPGTPERLTPTLGQFQSIIQTVRDQKASRRCNHTADLLEFMGLAGVGQAEAANLRGEHIDFARQEIHFFRQKTRTAFVVPLYGQLVPLLTRLAAQGRIAVGQPVFKVRDPKKALMSACDRLALPRFSPRALRRMFIVRALERGVDVRVLARWQGHSDGGVLIMKVYGRWVRGQHEQAMANLLA